MNGYCVHLQREFVNKPNDKITKQRLSYDLTEQNRSSIHEMHCVLKEFSKRSNGEFKYWITDYSKTDVNNPPSINDKNSIIYSSDLDEDERNKEDICTLHSGESETDS